MRIDVMTAHKNRVNSKIHIRLNGINQYDCIYADEEGGCIVKHKRHSNGNYVIVDNERIENITLHGKVEILMGDRK